MAGNYAVTLTLIAFVAYYVVKYLRKILFVLAVLLVTFAFLGIYKTVEAIQNFQPAPQLTVPSSVDDPGAAERR